MYLKIMSGENKPDSDISKQYRMIPISPDEYVEMLRFESGIPYVAICRRGFKGGIEFRPEGNCYLIDNGKTIATYSYSED